MKVLFVVPPLTGHVNPTVSIAAALRARGHEVAWAGHGERVASLLPNGARLETLGELPGDVVTAIAERSRRVRGLESVQFLWQDFLVPLAWQMRPAVERVIRSYRPDVLVADQQAVGGALAARRLGVPWATLCTTTAALVEPLAGFPKVKAWIDAQLVALQDQAELPVVENADLSPSRVIVLSTRELAGSAPVPPQVEWVGPAFAGRPDGTPFPWEALPPAPRVLVSLGTVSADRGAPFYAAVVAGVRAGVGAILVAPPELVPDPPPNVVVRARVPQLALLPHVDAVVTHAGHNTTCESLAHGLPLVCAPIRDDQPVIAGQVQAAGAGLRVRFAHPSPDSIGGAVARVLGEPSFRAAAERIRQSFLAAGGANRAAELVEALS